MRYLVMRIFYFLISFFFLELSAFAATASMNEQRESILYAHTDQFQAVGYLHKFSDLKPLQYLEEEFDTILQSFPLPYQEEVNKRKGTLTPAEFLSSLHENITWEDDFDKNLRAYTLNIDGVLITMFEPLVLQGSATLIDHTCLGLPNEFHNRVVLTCAHNLRFTHNELCNINRLTFHLKTLPDPEQQFSKQYEKRNVIKIFYPSEYTHEYTQQQFKENKKQGDVAFIILDEPFLNITPLSLADLSFEEALGKAIAVTGFPTTGLFSSHILINDMVKRIGQQVLNEIDPETATLLCTSYLTHSDPLSQKQLVCWDKKLGKRTVEDYEYRFFLTKNNELALYYNQQYLERMLIAGGGVELSEEAKKAAERESATEAHKIITQMAEEVHVNIQSSKKEDFPYWRQTQTHDFMFSHEPEKVYTIVYNPRLPILPLSGMSGGPALVWNQAQQAWVILGVVNSGVMHTGALGSSLRAPSGPQSIDRSQSASLEEHLGKLSIEFNKDDAGKDIRTSLGIGCYAYVKSYTDRFQFAFQNWLKAPEKDVITF